MKDFFVSYNSADRIWALGMQTWLEDAGYTTIMQATDFTAGSNFVLEMDRATKETERTVAVLSPDYLEAQFTHPEWASAFAADPTGSKRKLIPVKVRECAPSGLLKQIVHIDLVGLSVEAAHNKLINEIKHRISSDSTPLPTPVKRRSRSSKTIHQVAFGDGSLQAGGHIYLNKREVHRFVQNPGPEHITEEQAFTIQQHIKKLAEIDLFSDTPSYGRWQNKLKRRFKVTSYKLIGRHEYPAVLSWLRQQAAIMRPKLRRSNNDRWRAEFYAGIYAKANELGMSKQQLYDLANERLKLSKLISSLKDLGEQKLERFYRMVQQLAHSPHGKGSDIP